ncbi:MAG: ornithine cyclodeaminase family protein [Chloroflexi bacterium]|nr:ornithine cyclodeaminase family protein [Chloroflexota bacterium]
MALLINEAEVNALVSMPEAADTVADAFRQLGEGRAFNQARTRVKLNGEMLHVLPAALPELDAIGLKTYTGFRTGIRFTVILYSARTGEMKAIIQAQRLGELRTGGVAAVALGYLSRRDSTRGALFGTGVMGRAMLEGMVVARKFTQIKAFDIDPKRLAAFCEEMVKRTGVDVVPAASSEDAVRDADVVVTMTTAKDPVFDGKLLKPGTTVVAAGSNLLQKREVDSTVIRRSKRIVVESIEQCQAEAGDLFIPIDTGHLHWNQVHELSQLVLGRVPGRQSDDEINLFKSVGIGLQDLALGALVYERAKEAGMGMEVPI